MFIIKTLKQVAARKEYVASYDGVATLEYWVLPLHKNPNP